MSIRRPRASRRGPSNSIRPSARRPRAARPLAVVRARQPAGQGCGDQGREVVECAREDQIVRAVGIAGITDEDFMAAKIDLDGVVVLAEAQQHAPAQSVRVQRPHDRAALDEREDHGGNGRATSSPEANLRLVGFRDHGRRLTITTRGRSLGPRRRSVSRKLRRVLSCPRREPTWALAKLFEPTNEPDLRVFRPPRPLLRARAMPIKCPPTVAVAESLMVTGTEPRLRRPWCTPALLARTISADLTTPDLSGLDLLTRGSAARTSETAFSASPSSQRFHATDSTRRSRCEHARVARVHLADPIVELLPAGIQPGDQLVSIARYLGGGETPEPQTDGCPN